MVLAAGLGTRMRPLTDTSPKPLLKLGGRTLLDHALDHLVASGVETVAVNAHWLADSVADHLALRPPPPRTVLLREEHLLDTGGSVKAALGVLGADPFFVVNGDAFWVNGPIMALDRLAGAFDDSVDGVLLVQRTSHVHADVGYGDF
jgi:MurNAc alpha-1-phosphate uridylyltransferase